MKTSNIILLSVIISIFLWTTLSFVTAINTAKKLFEKNKTENKKDLKTENLENFSVLIISGNGKLTIEQAGENTFQYFPENKTLPEIKNDTLFLSVNETSNYLNVTNLKTIILKDKIEAYINNIKTDTLNIKSVEKTEAIANNLNIEVLNIITEDKSSAALFDLNGNNIETNLILKDKSKIYINKADNLNLGIKKDNEAQLEISN